MDRDVNIVKYLPPVIGNTLEFIEICKTEDIELSELWTNVDLSLIHIYIRCGCGAPGRRYFRYF